MFDDYLLIHKSILPEVYSKVLEVKHLLSLEKVSDVSTAVKKVDISRSTYYKYKDYILEPARLSTGRKAVLSLILNHQAGVLSRLLTTISQFNGNILTISQSMPIGVLASVVLSLDVSEMTISMHELIKEIEKIEGVENSKLIGIE